MNPSSTPQVIHRLAAHLGLMPDEVLEKLTSDELTAWAIYTLTA